ncbi:MAG: hypothetical protein K8L97_24545 [Anaerolineae bacterium]|nr:hypothetical protein [Anaerolineae bacterium]
MAFNTPNCSFQLHVSSFQNVVAMAAAMAMAKMGFAATLVIGYQFIVFS